LDEIQGEDKDQENHADSVPGGRNRQIVLNALKGELESWITGAGVLSEVSEHRHADVLGYQVQAEEDTDGDTSGEQEPDGRGKSVRLPLTNFLLSKVVDQDGEEDKDELEPKEVVVRVDRGDEGVRLVKDFFGDLWCVAISATGHVPVVIWDHVEAVKIILESIHFESVKLVPSVDEVVVVLKDRVV